MRTPIPSTGNAEYVIAASKSLHHCLGTPLGGRLLNIVQYAEGQNAFYAMRSTKEETEPRERGQAMPRLMHERHESTEISSAYAVGQLDASA